MYITTLDRSLKLFISGLVKALGYSPPDFKKQILKHYKNKGIDHVGKEYLKRINNPKVTWKTFLQTLEALGLEDKEIDMCFTHKLPISPTELGELKSVWHPLTNLDSTCSDLAPTELSLFLSKIIEESNVTESVYINRIIEWLLNSDPSLESAILRIKGDGFMKKVTGDKITWTTFLDGLSALGAKEGVFKMVIKDEETETVVTYELEIH